MPETKLQDFIYTLIMAFVMVYPEFCSLIIKKSSF